MSSFGGVLMASRSCFRVFGRLGCSVGTGFVDCFSGCLVDCLLVGTDAPLFCSVSHCLNESIGFSLLLLGGYCFLGSRNDFSCMKSRTHERYTYAGFTLNFSANLRIQSCHSCGNRNEVMWSFRSSLVWVFFSIKSPVLSCVTGYLLN